VVVDFNELLRSIKSRESDRLWNGTLREPEENFRKYTGA
jgi:hypothetical protein